MEMTKHTSPRYAFPKQMRHLYRRLIKARNIKLHSFINRYQKPNACLGELSPDTPG